MEKTQKKHTYSKWILWVCAGVLVVTACVLLVIGIVRGHERADRERKEPKESQTAEPETSEPENTEPEQVLLDLPLNPYGPEDFAWQEGYLTCTAGQSMLGIDVSAWQEEIDWLAVKESGVEFAMIRLAWRGTSEGGIYMDDRAEENYRGAKEAGLLVGGYFFSQAITPAEAVQEAQFLIGMIEGWEIDLPIVFDWEFVDDARTEGIDPKTLTACADAFCRTIEKAGYRPMIYFNPNMVEHSIDLERLDAYDFWLAMWQSEMVFPYKVHMWQYTDQGSVPGIEGDVDMNLYFIYEDA